MSKILGYGVKTDEGYIPYKSWRGIKLPVAVKRIPSPSKHKNDLTVPDRDEQGRFIYVLPGGGRIAFE